MIDLYYELKSNHRMVEAVLNNDSNINLRTVLEQQYNKDDLIDLIEELVQNVEDYEDEIKHEFYESIDNIEDVREDIKEDLKQTYNEDVRAYTHKLKHRINDVFNNSVFGI